MLAILIICTICTNSTAKILLSKGSNPVKIFLVRTPCNKKRPMTDSSKLRKSLTGLFVKMSNFNQENFVGEGSSPFSCRKYLWTVNPVFRKIYAHKWLCIAVCGHNIFLVTISWLGRKDLNPRNGGVRVHCLTAWRRPNN